MREKLLVSAIDCGSVIDHIPAGQGMKIVRLLQLAKHKNQVTLGLNLPSQSLGLKDIVKVSGMEITSDQIAIFAPLATVNVIRDFKVFKKFSVKLPEKIEKVLKCPNSCCITNHEKIETRFLVQQIAKKVELTCYYCEKGFIHDRF